MIQKIMFGKNKILFVFAIFFCSLSLSEAAFKKVDYHNSHPKNLKLPKLSKILPYSGYEISSFNGLKNFQVKLGRISAAQHEQLNLNFKSSERYEKDRDYELIDFLSPYIQATDGHIFYEHSFASEFENKAARIVSGINCWGATYAIASGNDGVYHLNNFQDHVYVYDILTNNSFSKELFTFNIERLSTNSEILDFVSKFLQVTENKIEPGDFIMIVHYDNMLSHTATYIDGELFFQKNGNDVGTMFGFATLSQMIMDYAMDTYNKVNLIVRRPLPGKLPKENEVFFKSIGNVGNLINFPIEIHLNRNAAGKFELPPWSIYSEQFQAHFEQQFSAQKSKK